MGFHSPLIRPAIYWGGGSFGGGTLDSHDSNKQFPCRDWICAWVADVVVFVFSQKPRFGKPKVSHFFMDGSGDFQPFPL